MNVKQVSYCTLICLSRSPRLALHALVSRVVVQHIRLEQYIYLRALKWPSKELKRINKKIIVPRFGVLLPLESHGSSRDNNYKESQRAVLDGMLLANNSNHFLDLQTE